MSFNWIFRVIPTKISIKEGTFFRTTLYMNMMYVWMNMFGDIGKQLDSNINISLY